MSRLKFPSHLRARDWLLILSGGVCLGLLLAWLQKRLQLNPRTVQTFLLVGSGILLAVCVPLLVAYVKELRREEEEWAGRDDEDAD